MLAMILFAAALICLLAIALVVPVMAWRIARIYWRAFTSAKSLRT